LGLCLALVPTAADAATGDSGSPSEVIFLCQITALVLLGRGLGEIMHRIGQPAVTGQLIAGLLLGPTVFGTLWPDAQRWLFPPDGGQKSMLDAVSQIGVLMLLLLTGMETDLRLVRRTGMAAVSVSIAGIVVPFFCGFVLGEFLPDAMLPRPELRIITSLFLGTALAIASIKIVAMVVREMNYMRRTLGQIIISSAIIDDAVGWIIISIIFSLAQHGAVDLPSLATSILGTAVFLALSLTIGRRLVFFIIRWTNDNFATEVPVISAILLIMTGMALITHFIGVHSVLGAFIAGVLIGESPILTRHIDEQLRGLITALFAPVFFGAAGLGTDLTILTDPNLLLLTVGLIVIASIGKFGGAFIGGEIGGLTRGEALALALGMNARGSTEVIIATIGLSIGALSHDLFSMIVAMAIITTMAMPPTLRWALKRLPLRPEEEKRLEREAFAERGFVSNLERLLLAIDGSANGKFAARIGGLLAGPLGMPTTILQIDPDLRRGHERAGAPPAAELDGAEAAATVKTAAQETMPLDASEDEHTPADIPVTVRRQKVAALEAVAIEAKKGYDLLLVGLDDPTAAPGVFGTGVSTIAAGFEGPIAIAVGRGWHLRAPWRNPARILVPVTGSGVSRRAAEVALTLAHAANAHVTALYVSSTRLGRQPRAFQQVLATQRAENAILKDAVEMADRLHANVTTAARSDAAPEDAIVREARRGAHDLIVMGVSRRPGDTLYFGRVASAVLEHAETSILFVASEIYAQERRPIEREETTR
jgi:Kef-type K+ transport system membrane component KefB/nucleotide-binding universal stress UspA family protein